MQLFLKSLFWHEPYFSVKSLLLRLNPVCVSSFFLFTWLGNHLYKVYPRVELSLPSAEQQDLVSGSTPVRWMRHVAQGHDAVPQLKGFRRKAFFSNFLCSLFGDLPVQFNNRKYEDIEIRGHSYMNVFKMTRKTFSGRNGIVRANDVSEPWLLHWI